MGSKRNYMATLRKPIVVNLYAGPGTGKSSSAADIFSKLKWGGINCEMALEFAKEKVWEESIKVLDDQIYIFAKQLHKMRRLIGKVDVIITDSPLLFSIMYDTTKNEHLKNLVLDVYKEFNNFDILLKREKPFEQAGRLQNEEKARELDTKIKDILNDYAGGFVTFPANPKSAENIADIITMMVNQEKFMVNDEKEITH